MHHRAVAGPVGYQRRIVVYRLVGHAEDRIDQIVMDSAREFGLEAAVRYNKLIFAGLDAVSATPGRRGSKAVSRVGDLRMFPLRLTVHLVAANDRVGRPRHLIVYRVAPDGVVEILSLVHDRLDMGRAARQAQRAASGEVPRDR